MSGINYSALDIPEVLGFVFYPRRDYSEPPPGSRDHMITVDDGIRVHCRFYVHSAGSPSILHFHGNGEVVSDYDYIAPMYNRLGLNLFVADYRGYGASGGQPTLSNAVSDACLLFSSFDGILSGDDYCRDVFVMGRSLGSISAIEIAHRHGEEIRGLVIESGFAAVVNLLSHLGFPARTLGIEDREFPNLARIRRIAVPTLIIHGENDQLIPASEGEALFRGSAAVDKRLLIIPGAGHNDIMWIGMEEYLEEIRRFTSDLVCEGKRRKGHAD